MGLILSTYLKSVLESSGGHQLHPLKIEDIIEEVFKNLKLNDLKTCRGVCKEWGKIATPILKSNSVVTLPPPPEKKIRLSDFVRCFEKSEDIPWSTYQFDFWDVPIDHSSVTEFWATCGPSIQEIQSFRVHNPRPITLADFERIFKETPNLERLTFDCLPLNVLLEVRDNLDEDFVRGYVEPLLLPKLRSIRLPYLRLGYVEERLDWKVWRIRPFWTNFLFRSVEVLDASCWKSNFNPSLITAITYSTFYKISSLKFGRLDGKDIRCLMQTSTLLSLKNRIKELSVREFGEDVEVDSLRPILEEVKSSLKVLRLGIREDDRKYVLTSFPRMEELEVLQLDVTGKSSLESHAYPIQSILFSKDLPKLSRLNLLGHVSGTDLVYDWAELFQEGDGNLKYPCHSLRKLKFDWNYYVSKFAKNLFVTDSDLVQVLGRIFPSVRTLKIWPTESETLKALFNTFREVRVLELGFSPGNIFTPQKERPFELYDWDGDYEDGEIIVPMEEEVDDDDPIESHREHQEVKNVEWMGNAIFLGEVPSWIRPEDFLNPDELDKSILIQSKLIGPSISSFENLERLRFIYKGFGYRRPPPRFTDVDGYLAFANLSGRVRRLEFGANTKMSAECLDYLRRKLPKASITFASSTT